MKTLWDKLTLMKYATADDDGKTKWWHYVLSGVVVGIFYAAMNIGAAVGY